MYFRSCMIEIGDYNPEPNFDGFWGIDHSNRKCALTFLYNDDDEIFAFILDKSDANVFVGNTDIGTPDCSSLRNLMPKNYEKKFNEILLASVDIEEIYEEGLHHFHYLPDYDVEDTTRPYFLRLDFPNVDDLQKYIFVKHIYGSFRVDHTSIEKDELENLLAGNIQTAIVLSGKNFGEIDEYATDTEQLVMIEK